MAGLFEFVASLADEDACMQQLSDGCGLGSPAEGRRAYGLAARLIEQRLLDIGRSPVATKSLLRSARSLQQTEHSDPRAQFELGHVVGDELVHELFGPEADAAVRALAADLAGSDDQARSVLEITTAVFIGSAVGMTGDEVTFESLHAQLSAEQGDRRSATPTATDPVGARGPDTAPGAMSAVGADGTGRRSKAWLLAVPVLLLVAVGVVALVSGGDEDTTLAFTDESTTTAPAVDPAVDTDADADTAADADAGGDAQPSPTSPDEPAADEAEGQDEPAPADSETAAADQGPDIESPPVPPGAPDNHAVMSQGKIFLRGYLPSADVEQLIVAAVEQIVGPGAVVSEYVIDPDRPVEEDDEGTPVYIEDTVLFATGSAEIAPDFAQLLGAGLRLLQVQPGVTLEVTGHTDSEGPAAANLALSQSRVDAVKEFFVAQGIEPDRIVAIGKGETEPRADNGTPEGRQANRRVEFLVKGFTYGP